MQKLLLAPYYAIELFLNPAGQTWFLQSLWTFMPQLSAQVAMNHTASGCVGYKITKELFELVELYILSSSHTVTLACYWVLAPLHVTHDSWCSTWIAYFNSKQIHQQLTHCSQSSGAVKACLYGWVLKPEKSCQRINAVMSWPIVSFKVQRAEKPHTAPPHWPALSYITELPLSMLKGGWGIRLVQLEQ